MTEPEDALSEPALDALLSRGDLLRGALLGGAGLGLGAVLGAEPAAAQDRPRRDPRVLIAITHGSDDPDRALLGLVIAATAVKAGQRAVVWLTLKGAELAHKDKAPQLRSKIFDAHGDALTLMTRVKEGAGVFGVCPPCAAAAGATGGDRLDFVPERGADWMLALLGGARAVWL